MQTLSLRSNGLIIKPYYPEYNCDCGYHVRGWQCPRCKRDTLSQWTADVSMVDFDTVAQVSPERDDWSLMYNDGPKFWEKLLNLSDFT